jgi:hypothetical protein
MRSPGGCQGDPRRGSSLTRAPLVCIGSRSSKTGLVPASGGPGDLPCVGALARSAPQG